MHLRGPPPTFFELNPRRWCRTRLRYHSWLRANLQDLTTYAGWAKKSGTIFVCLITSPNTNRFPKVFLWQNQKKM